MATGSLLIHARRSCSYCCKKTFASSRVVGTSRGGTIATDDDEGERREERNIEFNPENQQFHDHVACQTKFFFFLVSCPCAQTSFTNYFMQSPAEENPWASPPMFQITPAVPLDLALNSWLNDWRGATTRGPPLPGPLSADSSVEVGHGTLPGSHQDLSREVTPREPVTPSSLMMDFSSPASLSPRSPPADQSTKSLVNPDSPRSPIIINFLSGSECDSPHGSPRSPTVDSEVVIDFGEQASSPRSPILINFDSPQSEVVINLGPDAASLTSSSPRSDVIIDFGEDISSPRSTMSIDEEVEPTRQSRPLSPLQLETLVAPGSPMIVDSTHDSPLISHCSPVKGGSWV